MRRAFDSSVAPVGAEVLHVRGLEIEIEVHGRTSGGLPVVLTPGGGGGKGGFRWLAQRLKSGRQTLVWDRPNTGGSGMTLGDDERQPEFDLQADYLHQVLHSLGLLPAVLLGKSNGARLSLVFAAKYPQDCAALVLLNVTNGSKAAKRLSAERYYQHLDTCANFGLAAVAKDPHYTALFERNPANRARLLSWGAERFMLQMKLWGDALSRAGDAVKFPVTGLPRELLQGIQQPALCVYVADPGGKDDGMHTLSAMRALHGCLPGAYGPAVVTDDKEVYVRAIQDFIGALSPPTHMPQSPSPAKYCAPLAVRPGMYPQLPNDAELAQMRAYYAQRAAEGAEEEAREKKSLCSLGGFFDSWYSTKRVQQR